MKLIAKKTHDIKRVIADCYKTDSELIEKYHKLSPTTLGIATDYTVGALSGIKNELEFFELYCDDDFCGYFAIQAEKIIVGFFLLPKFRNKEVILKFWRIVKSKFKDEILCGLYEHNIRAIKFLKKTGFTLFNEVEPNMLFFRFRFH